MARMVLRLLKTRDGFKHLQRSANWSSKRFSSSGLKGETEEVKQRPEIGQTENLLDIGTRRIFSEEHDIFRESFRRFLKEEITPNQDRWEKQGHVGRETWAKLGSAGFLGVTTSPEYGGGGGDFKSAAILMEEVSYTNYGGSAWPLQSDVAMPYIEKYGTQEQKEKFLPAMAAGTNIGAIAMTEPSAGSDLQGIKTHAKKDGEDWILNGSKVFISNGYLAHTVIVVAVTQQNQERKAHGISLFLVEDGMPGFKKGRILEKIGQKSLDVNELFFEDVRLPASALLGGEAMMHRGFYHLMDQLPRERLIVGIIAQSHAEYMFEITREYVRKRKAFGKTLSKLQTIQHRLAEMKTEICVGRAFVDMCLQLYVEGKLDNGFASMCKYWISDMNNRVATECLQLHGGWGYMWEYPIARAFTNSRVFRIYAGSNEIMKELIARDIVKD